MVTEEKRTGTQFKGIKEFLDHWFYTCHDYQEDSKLEAMYTESRAGGCSLPCAMFSPGILSST